MLQPIPFDREDAAPPQNIEVEEAVLGGLLLDPNAIDRISENLEPWHFYVGAHRRIYSAALELYAEEKPCDLIQVAVRLQDKNDLEKVGGNNKLADLVSRTVSATNIDYYAELIVEKAIRRRMIQAGNQVVDLGNQVAQPLEESIDRMEQIVFEISDRRSQNDLVPPSEFLGDLFDQIETRAIDQTLPGLLCGFYDLDAMTGGFQRSDLITIAARPSMGKTSFALAIARNISRSRELPVAIFSLEMSKEQLVTRLLSMESRIESTRLKAGRIAQQEWEPLAQAVGEISESLIHIDDSPNPSVSEMRSKCRRLAVSSAKPLGAVVIDYLQLMGSGDDRNRVQELARITRQLKGLARELKVPVIILSQLSRGVESRNDKRPMMSDVRESGAIEQDSDLLILLYRDEYYNPDTPDRGIAEIIVAKQRNGPTGTVKLIFEANFMDFKNLAKSGY